MVVFVRENSQEIQWEITWFDRGIVEHKAATLSEVVELAFGEKKRQDVEVAITDADLMFHRSAIEQNPQPAVQTPEDKEEPF